MKKIGKMWIDDNDVFFERVFQRTGDKFEDIIITTALKYVTNFNIAIDGGAHYGTDSRLLSNYFTTVHAYEPMDIIYDCCVKNIYGFDNVKLHKIGLGIEEEHISLRTDWDQPGRNSGCSNVIREFGEIEIQPLDFYGFSGVGLIKLDIEGYEYFALKGAENTIKESKPVIVFENKGHHKEYGLDDNIIDDFLLSLGYIKQERILGHDDLYVYKG